MSDDHPTPEQALGGVEGAVAHRRAVHRATPRYAHHTRAALAERVVALPAPPLRMRGGWWRVGFVLDAIADEELVVRLDPATGRVQGAPPPPEGAKGDDLRRRLMKRWE
jgi:hypothetical protein